MKDKVTVFGPQASSSRWLYTPEGFVHRSVPTDKRAGGEEEPPQDCEAQANTARGVHAEHGQGGDQVEEQRASADWTFTKTEKRRQCTKG